MALADKGSRYYSTSGKERKFHVYFRSLLRANDSCVHSLPCFGEHAVVDIAAATLNCVLRCYSAAAEVRIAVGVYHITYGLRQPQYDKSESKSCTY